LRKTLVLLEGKYQIIPCFTENNGLPLLRRVFERHRASTRPKPDPVTQLDSSPLLVLTSRQVYWDHTIGSCRKIRHWRVSQYLP
jgi:hypothetical protein